jgi:hypothetical protein
LLENPPIFYRTPVYLSGVLGSSASELLEELYKMQIPGLQTLGLSKDS